MAILVLRSRDVYNARSYRTNHKKQIVTVHGLSILGNDSNNLEHLSGWKERVFTVTEGREVYRRETLHRFQETKGLLRIDDITGLDKFRFPGGWRSIKETRRRRRDFEFVRVGDSKSLKG